MQLLLCQGMSYLQENIDEPKVFSLVLHAMADSFTCS